jgi:hypothetical protein
MTLKNRAQWRSNPGHSDPIRFRFSGCVRIWFMEWKRIPTARRRFAWLLLGCCVTGSTGHAEAIGNTSPQLPAVTVTAPRPPTKEELAGDSVSKFIAAHGTHAVVTGQLARWREGICPVTSGLSPGFNAFVSARLLAVAAAVGAPSAEGRCRHNVQIIFTTDPQRILDEVVKHRPFLLGFHYSRQTQNMVTFDQPIQGWYVTATRNDEGLEVTDNPIPIRQGSSPISSTSPAHWLESGTSPPGDAGSRLTTGLTSLIAHALILVDTKKVAGDPIGAVSDYLAMMVLTQTRAPDECGRLPSILDLMASQCDGGDKPDAMTAGDLAFLRALYAIDLRESLALEGSDIRTHMMRQFEGH